MCTLSLRGSVSSRRGLAFGSVPNQRSEKETNEKAKDQFGNRPIIAPEQLQVG